MIDIPGGRSAAALTAAVIKTAGRCTVYAVAIPGIVTAIGVFLADAKRTRGIAAPRRFALVTAPRRVKAHKSALLNTKFLSKSFGLRVTSEASQRNEQEESTQYEPSAR